MRKYGFIEAIREFSAAGQADIRHMCRSDRLAERIEGQEEAHLELDGYDSGA